MINLEGSLDRDFFETRIKNLLPTLKDWGNSIGAILRGSVLGFLLGIVPGGGAILASFFRIASRRRFLSILNDSGQE